MTGLKVALQDNLSKKINDLPKALTKAKIDSINAAARQAKKFAAAAVREDVNLPARYVNRHITVKNASNTRPTAILLGRFRATLLYRYRTRILTKKAKHPRKSKGFAKYNIPPGRKFAGVSVSVLRGGPRKKIRGGFLMTLQNSAATGIMLRFGKKPKDFKTLYGPSVSQVMEWNDDEIIDFIEREVAREFDRNLPAQLSRVGL